MHISWKPPEPLARLLESSEEFKFGQVSAVAKGNMSDIWVFQRGEVVWDQNTFSGDKAQYVTDPRAFVKAPAVVQLDQVQPLIIQWWSAGRHAHLMGHS